MRTNLSPLFAFCRVFGFCFLCCASRGESLPSIGEAQRAVVAYRESMESGRFLFRSKYIEDGLHQEARDVKIDARFDGKRLRCDIWRRRVAGKGGPLYRVVECRNCEGDGIYLNYNELFKGSDSVKPELLSMPYNEDETDREGWTTVDPRVLGLAPTEMQLVPRYKVSTFVMPKHYRNQSIVWDQYEERDCWLVQYRNSVDIPVRYWIDPKLGPSVVKMECDLFAGTDEMRSSVKSDYARHAESGYWYPSTVTYVSRRRNGDTYTETQEEVEIEIVSINEKLPREEFQMVGFDIAKGTRIVSNDVSRGQAYWNGEEVAYDAFQPRLTETTNTWLTWFTSIMSIGAGAAAVWLYLRRR